MAEHILCKSCGKDTDFNNLQVEMCHNCYSKLMDRLDSKHAPVIDAEKLAEKISNDYWLPPFEPDELFLERKEKVKREVAQLITSSIDLNITWVDGKAGGE